MTSPGQRRGRTAGRAGTGKRKPRQQRAKSDKRIGDTAPISRLVEDFIERSGMAQEVGLALCKKHWADACGSNLARRSRPIRMDGSVLVVAVSDSICFQELNMNKRNILASLADRITFGRRPNDLHFVVAVPD